MNQNEFQNYFAERIRIGDGACATYLHSLGEKSTLCFEELNLTRPDRIHQVHADYLAAGADVLETNSFCANPHKLKEYQLEGQTAAILKQAVDLAKEAANKYSHVRKIYVLGALGPLTKKRSELDAYDDSLVEKLWNQTIAPLVEQGVDALLFETFSRLSDLEFAVKVAKQYHVPVIAQLAFSESGITDAGVSVRRAFQRLEELDVAMVGANCRVGPAHASKLATRMQSDAHLFLSIFPNSRYLADVQGRLVHDDAPNYFASQFETWADHGVRLIGGCCGTTPDHIRALVKARDEWEYKNPQLKSVKSPNTFSDRFTRESERTSEKTQEKSLPPLLDTVNKHQFVTVELEPPRDLNLKLSFEHARAFIGAGCDTINIPDNALSRVYMNHLVFAQSLRQELDCSVIAHLACRDKNLLALRSDLLAAHMLGLEGILAVTGDPASGAEGTDASTVYDVTSIGLVEMISSMNMGWSLPTLKQRVFSNFAIGVGASINVARVEGLRGTVMKTKKKIHAGAQFIMTQPVFDEQLVNPVAQALLPLGLPVALGVMPILNAKNAEFLHHEVPGIRIPESVRRRFARLNKDQSQALGIQLCKELIDHAFKAGISKFYLIPTLGRVETIVELVRYIKEYK